MRFLISIVVGAFVIAASGSPFWGFVAFFVFWVISDNDQIAIFPYSFYFNIFRDMLDKQIKKNKDEDSITVTGDIPFHGTR